MHCGYCGAAINENDKVCAKCGKQLSAMDQEARWTPSAAALSSTDQIEESGIAYSGFWRRFGAALIDGLVLLAAMFAVSFLTAFAGNPGGASIFSALITLGFWLVAPWLYFALMECSASQATLGKMAVGVKVADIAGRRIGFGRATGRYWGKCVSQLTMYVGYIIAAFTARKQALHDMMAGTIVVLRAPSPAALAAGARSGPMSGWLIALIVLGCMVPVFGILAGISIPAYKTYTLRAQVAEGLNLADGLKAEIAEKLTGSDRPIAEDLATLKVDTVSNMFVSSLTLESGAIIITFGNQADSRLTGQTLALAPGRDEKGKIWWFCGRRPVHEALEQGGADPVSLTTLPASYLPASCRPLPDLAQ